MQQKSSIENRIILLNFYTFLFSIALQSSVMLLIDNYDDMLE